MEGKLKIMLIDQYAADQRCFHSMVKKMDMPAELIQVKTGADALRYFDGDCPVIPDYIFIDVMLPQRNGFELLSLLAQLPALKQTGLILCSDTDPVILEDIALRLGAMACIKKNTDAEIMIPQLKKLFANASPGRMQAA